MHSPGPPHHRGNHERERRCGPGGVEEHRPDAPERVRRLVETLESEGFETWAVGGAVRDTLLGIESGDWDLATRARPEQVQRLFRRTVPIGVEHGTVGVITGPGEMIEVTTFRHDVETDGRRAVVKFADELEDDLARRDFTINAIAWHPLREELYDPFDGLADLESGVVRTVGDPEDRFAEDYLRVLRALRFAGTFSMEIEEGTWEALCRATDSLGILSPERVREELMKVLGGARTPSVCLELYRTSGVLRELYPELHRLTIPSPGGDDEAWPRSLEICDAVSVRLPVLRLAALLHGIGGQEAAAVLIRLRFSNAEIRQVTNLVTVGIDPPGPHSSPAELRRWASRVGRDLLPSLFRLWVASARVHRLAGPDRAASVADAWRALRRELRKGPALSPEELAVNGRDLIGLGLKPGPRFGEILDHLLDQVLEDPALNERETLLEEVEAYLESTDAGDGDRSRSADE